MAIVYIAVRLGHKRVKYPIAIASRRGNPQLLPVGEIPNYFALLAFVLELKEVSSYLVDKENSRKLSAGYSPSKKLSSWFEVNYWASEASPTLVVWRCRPFPIFRGLGKGSGTLPQALSFHNLQFGIVIQ